MNVYMLREGGGDCRIWQKCHVLDRGPIRHVPGKIVMDDSISAHKGGGRGRRGGRGGGGEGTYRLNE
jgi:hypothetical protein